MVEEIGSNFSTNHLLHASALERLLLVTTMHHHHISSYLG
jgi:hypothetical protein